MNIVKMLRNEKDVVEAEPGTYVFRKGDACDAMYAVLEGKVAIFNGSVLIEEVAAGGIFGEMALVDGSPRSADAVAGTAVKLAKIDEQRFLSLAQYNPYFTLEVLRGTVARLRRLVTIQNQAADQAKANGGSIVNETN